MTSLFIIIGYLCLLIGLGLVSNRFSKGTSADFFVVSRTVGGWTESAVGEWADTVVMGRRRAGSLQGTWLGANVSSPVIAVAGRKKPAGGDCAFSGRDFFPIVCEPNRHRKSSIHSVICRSGRHTPRPARPRK